MSTAAPRRSDSAAPSPDLLHPLARLRGIIHTYVVLDAAMFALLFLTCWFWIGITLDWGLFALTGVDVVQGMPAIFRMLTTAFLGILLLTLLFLRVFRLLRQELSDTNLALLLEKRYPKLLGGRLITAIEMADVDRAARRGYSREMVVKTIADARERVGRVSVSRVFNWLRLWVKLFLILGVSLLTLGGGLVAFLIGSEPTVPGSYAAKVTDVAHIWTERHLTFAGTPWPRRAHVELIGFPESGELRVGKTAAGPTIRARAYKWVVAAPGTRDGWRPLLWSDLNGEPIRGTVMSCPSAPPITALVAANPTFKPSTVPPDATPKQLADGLALLTADEVEFALGLDVDAEVAAALAEGFDTVEGILDRTENLPVGTSLLALKDVFRRLNALSRDASMSRTFRRLLVPRLEADESGQPVLDEAGKPVRVDLRLEYTGKKSGAPVSLAREPSGASVGQIAGLKESVWFDVQFENFSTDLKQIVLVPPPLFTDLRSTDYHPAYLYYKAPGGDLSVLRGLKQVFAGNRLSLTGDVTDHQVPFGSEIELTATTDKPLKHATLTPKTPNLRKQEADADRAPAAAGDLAVASVPAEVDEDGTVVRPAYSTVTVTFRKHAHRDTVSGTPVTVVDRDESITQPTEFELEITDLDGVSATRTIKFRTTEDAAPEVKLNVDDLFKVGSEYWCTPLARLPFAAGSGVTDASGLSKVEFQFKWNTVESAALAAVNAEQAGTPVSAAPPAAAGAPTPAVAAVTAAVTAATLSLDAGTSQVRTGTFPVARFAREYDAIPPDTPESLRRKAAGKFDGNFGVVKSVKLADPATDVFDVEAALPALAAKPDEIQPRYLVKLNVVGTDSNADRTTLLNDWACRRIAANTTLPARRYEVDAPPKTAEEATAVNILIVSEAELMVEVTKKESQLYGKVAEAVKLAEDALRKLNETAGYLAAPTPDQETLKNAAVRSGDIILDVAKSRGICQDLLIQYTNFATILKVNRVNAALIKAFENPPPPGSAPTARGTGHVDRLSYMLRLDPNPGPFQTTGTALDAFQTPLAVLPPVRPTDQQISTARNELTALVRELDEFKKQIEGNTDFKKQLEQLQKIVTSQDNIKTGIVAVIAELQAAKRGPRLTPPDQVKLAPGATQKVKIKIDWQLYRQDEILITTEKVPATSDVEVVKDFALKEEKAPTEFEFEVKAGMTPGITVIKLKPAIGRVAELRIEVAK